jgi:hypothetical protein
MFVCIEIEADQKEKDTWDPYLLNTDLNSLSNNQIKWAALGLEKIKKWEENSYTFWYETVTIMCCGKNHSQYPFRVFISYHYNEWEIEVPFEDIYNLMKDWKEYIEEWEKETWKKMP